MTALTICTSGKHQQMSVDHELFRMYTGSTRQVTLMSEIGWCAACGMRIVYKTEHLTSNPSNRLSGILLLLALAAVAGGTSACAVDTSGMVEIREDAGADVEPPAKEYGSGGRGGAAGHAGSAGEGGHGGNVQTDAGGESGSAGHTDAGAEQTPDTRPLPLPETCNGKDDDGDGVIDNGDVCPFSSNVYSGRSFSLISSPKTWSDAETFCETYGRKLAVVTNEDEEAGLLNEFKNLGKGSVWIGLKKDGAWRWLNGADVIYTAWIPGQPDGSGGSETCGSINGFSGYFGWDDNLCSDTFPFFCEAP